MAAASLKVLTLLEQQLNEETTMIHNLERKLKKSLERRKVIIESIITISKTMVDASTLNAKDIFQAMPAQMDILSTIRSKGHAGHASRLGLSSRRKRLRAEMREYVQRENEKKERETLKIKAAENAKIAEAVNAIAPKKVVKKKKKKINKINRTPLRPIVKVKKLAVENARVSRSSNKGVAAVVAQNDNSTKGSVSPPAVDNEQRDPLKDASPPEVKLSDNNSIDLKSVVSPMDAIANLSSEITVFVKKPSEENSILPENNIVIKDVKSTTENNIVIKDVKSTTEKESVTLTPVNNDPLEDRISVKSESYSDVIDLSDEKYYETVNGETLNFDDSNFDTYHGLSDNSSPLPEEADPISIAETLKSLAPRRSAKQTGKIIKRAPQIRKTDDTSAGRRLLYKERLKLKRLTDRGETSQFDSSIVCFICQNERYDGKSLHWRCCKFCQNRFASPGCYGFHSRPYVCSECLELIKNNSTTATV